MLRARALIMRSERMIGFGSFLAIGRPPCTGDSGRFWSLGAILGPLALQLRVVILQLDPALAPIGQAGFYVRARFAFYGSPHTAQAQSSGVPRIPTELDKGAKSLFPDAC